MEDGFNFFLVDVKKKVQEWSSAYITETATSTWRHMEPKERLVYELQARHTKQNSCHVNFENNLHRRRRHCARGDRAMNRDKKQVVMTQEIEDTVVSLQRQMLLETHPFHLVHVNYYCKHSSGRYLGCEIALAEFSFVDGVRKTYHTFINPGDIPTGYAFEARRHAANTHRIPLAPDSFVSVSDHAEIFNNIKSFVRGEYEDETRLQPLYARPGDIEAVESVLRQLQHGPDAGQDVFRVYSASKLFHELRNASMLKPSEEIVHPNFLDERQLIDDKLSLTLGIACDFHEKEGGFEYCSLSYVHRWIYLLMKECLWPLGIRMIPGKHIALSTDVFNTKFLYNTRKFPPNS
jgi:hypothetical protein